MSSSSTEVVTAPQVSPGAAAAEDEKAKKKKKKDKKKPTTVKKGRSKSPEDHDDAVAPVGFDSRKLHTAKDAKKVSKYLGREGVDVGFLCDGDTPLHAYVRRKDKNKLDCLMAFLMDPKCDVNVVNEEGDSPLHLACKLADLASAKALIAFDADINKFNASTETPYDIAVQKSSAIADVLTGIGGMDALQIMANLQIYGSLKDHLDWQDQEFEPVLDPAVLCMDNHGVHTDEGGAGGGGEDGDGTAGNGGPDRGVVREELEETDEDKMPSIPEGAWV